MRLNLSSDYALRLLMFLAANPGQRHTIADIAAHYDISRMHLMKIAHQLSLHGWVDSSRGKGGGLQLARPAQTILIGQLLRQTEADCQLVECMGPESSCVLQGCCKLTGVLYGALQAFFAYLDRYTLADLVNDDGLQRLLQPQKTGL
jgi:Rrf2 family nitric oxide-sensitive transcriptional repressor